MTLPAALILAAAIGLQPVAPAQPAKPDASKPEAPKADPTKAADWPFTADKPEKIGEEYGFSEGPTWVPSEGGKGEGTFIFCDAGKNTVYMWSPSGSAKPQAVRKDSDGAIGSTADAAGHVFQVDSGTRRITTWTIKDGKAEGVKTLAETFEGGKLGGMNDVAVHTNGSLYVSHGTWFLPKGEKSPFEGVLRVTPDGKTSKLVEGLSGPNGICFSPDGKTVYVTEYHAGRINAYAMKDDGTLGEKKVFADLSAMAPQHGVKGKGGADGIRVDSKGNIFSTGPGGIWVLNAKGEFIAHLPTRATNLAFGGADGKTLLITNGNSVSRIGVKTPGAGW